MNELLPLMSYCLLMSSTPGPNNVMLTTLGANFGYRASLAPILGINAGVFALTLLCGLGLGGLFAAWPPAQQALRVAGVLYLIYLAWRLARSADAGAGTVAWPLSFGQAALFQLLNPKSWVKAITMAAVFMPGELSVPLGALLLGGVGWLIGFPCNSVWALFGVAIRGLLGHPRRRRVFNGLMGLTLLLLAMSLLRPSSA